MCDPSCSQGGCQMGMPISASISAAVLVVQSSCLGITSSPEITWGACLTNALSQSPESLWERGKEQAKGWLFHIFLSPKVLFQTSEPSSGVT